MKQIDLGPEGFRKTGETPPARVRLWHHDPQPIFLPGSGKTVLVWISVTAIALAIGFALMPIYDFGYWLSCNYITGSCRPQ